MKIYRMSWILLPMLFFIISCGGGNGGSGGSGKVDGVAAAGAPINGWVTLKDQNGTELGPVVIAVDGKFSFDVSGLTPPFILKAEGKVGAASYTLYSINLGTGHGNINPLTNLIIAVAAGKHPERLYGTTGTPPDTTALTDEALQAALLKVKVLLQPLLDEYGISAFDPINGDYEANPQNSLDAMLDTLAFPITAEGVLTITNKSTGTVIGSGSVADFGAVTLNKNDAPDKSSLTDIREITDRVAALGTVLANRAALTSQSLDEFFVVDSEYESSVSYHNRTKDIAYILSFFGPGGANAHNTLIELKNVQIVRDITDDYLAKSVVSKVYIINFDFVYDNGVVRGTNVNFGKETASSTWKFIGYPNILPIPVLMIINSGPVNYAGGLIHGIGVSLNNVIAGDSVGGLVGSGNVGGLVGSPGNQGTYAFNPVGLVGNLTTTGSISGSHAINCLVSTGYVVGLFGNITTSGNIAVLNNSGVAVQAAGGTFVTGSYNTVPNSIAGSDNAGSIDSGN